MKQKLPFLLFGLLMSMLSYSQVANQPSDLIICDDDDDGFAQFNLTFVDAEVLGSQNPSDYSISYHVSQNNADTNNNPIVNLNNYTNITNPQVIYVRLEDNVTGSFDTTSLNLEVQIAPTIFTPTALENCDPDGDGFGVFTLTDADAEITGGASGLTVTYHETMADAENNTNSLPTVFNNFVTGTQTIYVRVEDATLTVDCASFVELQLIVYPSPVINLAYDNELNQCDDLDVNYNENNDGFSVFDLTLEIPEITNGNTNYSVTFFETNADAQANVNVIANPTAYTNIVVGNQTLYVRVTDNNSGCSSFTTTTIRVLPNPSPGNPDDLIVCSNSNNEIFDLTQNELIIFNGEVGNTISYYTSQADAITATNAIVNPTFYNNTSSPETIYVRLENNMSGCFSLVNFDIVVNLSPEVVPVDDYIICELFADGVAVFDLESKTPEILSLVDPFNTGDFSVTYYETQVDADNAINAIFGPYTNVSNPQTIYVNVTTTAGCDTSAMNFNIEVQEAAQANSDGVPIVYELCDDNIEFDADITNDSAQFDLSIQHQLILDGQNPANYSVSYYNSQNDADTGVNSLPLLFNNTINPQTIYARVDNNNSSCYDTSILTLQVKELPSFNLDNTYLLCVNTNGTQTVSTPIIDTGLNTTQYTFEWSYEGTVLPSESGASIQPIQGGNYSVIVTNINTSCWSNDTTLVEVSEPPVFTAEVTSIPCSSNNVINVTANTTMQNSIGLYEFKLDSGVWQTNSPNDGVFTFENVSEGNHIITVRDLNGCGETFVNITVLACVDSDSDGVQDSDEDINGNGNLDDDDTDMDMIPNYLDDDDDGDNVPTNVEINIPTTRMAQHPFVDTDLDTIENYLDDDDDGDLILTINEDYNNNGDPTDDDTDMSGTPDYLEANVALSVEDFNLNNSFSLYPNPVKENVIIKLNTIIDKEVSIELIDVQGKIIISKTLPDEVREMQLNVSSLSSGVYFVKIENSNNAIIKKLVVE
ncbi:T9SS type A sorting domain-containing protein [uncultured Lacinutrix sp.]|uniref:T9SS type A sorting domain-containing protein n=1 Tax=uncultured Lacinutrix sp. TaxID=574032 RepID=UPI002620CAE9|nr:T9SS type A sorting domain-containing protein [uncultured Lacinutrix sp.]